MSISDHFTPILRLVTTLFDTCGVRLPVLYSVLSEIELNDLLIQSIKLNLTRKLTKLTKLLATNNDGLSGEWPVNNFTSIKIQNVLRTEIEVKSPLSST